MDEKMEIYGKFMFGPMLYLDAVEAISKLGYSYLEAQSIVDEWIDGEHRTDTN